MHHYRYLIAAIAALAAGAASVAFRLVTRDMLQGDDLPILGWPLLIAKAVLLYPVWKGYDHLARTHRDSWLAKTAEAAFIGFAMGDGLVIAAHTPESNIPWEVTAIVGVVLLCIALRIILQLAGDLFGPAVGMGAFLICFIAAGVSIMAGGSRFVLIAMLVLVGLLLLGLTLCYYWRLVELRKYLGAFGLAVGVLGLMQIGVLFLDLYRPTNSLRIAPELTAAVAPAVWLSHAALMFVLHRKSAAAHRH